MNRHLLFLLIGTLILSGGCTMAPDYTRPAAPIASDWPSGEAYRDIRSNAGGPTAPEVRWNDFFVDEKLQEIIGLALDNNRDLRLAALNVERTRALYGVQRAQLFPAVNATGAGAKQQIPADYYSTGRSTTSSTGGSITYEQYSVNLGISAWEIDFFGRIRSLKDSALEEFLATEQARRSAQILLVSEVAGTYLTLAADREHLKLAESTLETQKEAFDLVHRRFEIGLASELDVHRAQTQVDTARADIARFTQLVAQDENALVLLVGASSTIPEKMLPADLDSIQPASTISPGISSEVLLRRPDILMEEHRLKAAYANIGAARAAFFPRISLTSSFGTASSELSGLFKSGSSAWSFAPQIVMPVFDARTWSALKVSKTDREIALTMYEGAIQKAFREVADALAVRGTVDKQLSAQQSLVDAVAETYRLSRELYEKGIDSYLGVLDAQRSLYDAQQGLITLRLNRLVNLVRLYAALGGGA